MAKTKQQKIKAIEEGLENLKHSETVILADFTGLTVNEMNAFRRILKAAGIAFKVIKKRLLKLVFEKAGMEFDPSKFEGQTGVVFSARDLVETSGAVYKLSKTKEIFKILGGFDLKEKRFVDAAEIKKLGGLPSREVLLGQLVGVLSAPLRMLMYVLNEKGRKG